MRVDGDWEGWLDFFLDGVATIADEAVASGRELRAAAGVLVETTGKKRDRSFVYQASATYSRLRVFNAATPIRPEAMA